MNYVLKPLSKEELKGFFGEKEIRVLKYFLYKTLIAQPELMIGQQPLPIQIPKEHIEQWLVQALNVSPIGAGSYPIDVYSTDGHWGADVKMLSAKVTSAGELTRGQSGETSIAQKFDEIGAELDTWFSNGEYEKIKEGWLTVYEEKYKELESYLGVQKIYYFFLIRAGLTFYLVGVAVDLTNLSNVSVSRSTTKSIFLENFIDSSLGGTKLYKSKKRLELRLRPKAWQDSGLCIKFELKYQPSNINLLDTIQSDSDISTTLKKLCDDVIDSQLTVE